MILYSIIFIPVIMAVVIYILPFRHHKALSLLTQSCMMGLTIMLFVQEDINHLKPMVHALGDYPSWIGINLLADPISALLLMLTSFIFLMTILYAYHKPILDKQFLFLLLMLEGVINGIFLDQDLFSLYALIEVSTIIVSILIMYKKDGRSIYDGIIYLLINMISMTFFLVGLGYVYKQFGTLDLLSLKKLMVQVEDPRSLILPYTFMMTAVGLKSAVMPLFSWLPRAHGTHSAPYIVSAILSGLYIKSSLYIFIRVQAVFGEMLDTNQLFLLLGFLTAIIATTLALSYKDIKLILAYSTVSQIGFIIYGLSLNHTYSYYGSIYHIVNHAIFKTVLFLCAGILIDHYNTRDIREIRSVFKTMPYVSMVMITAILGVTGAPLFNGSISKYLIQRDTQDTLIEVGLYIMNIGTIMYMIHFAQIFKGHTPVTSKFPKPPMVQKMVIGLLALVCFIGGIMGHHLVNLFFDISLRWTFTDYLNKSIVYLLSLLVAFMLYKYVYPKLKMLHNIAQLELSFNELVFSIVFFFAGLLSYLMVMV